MSRGPLFSDRSVGAVMVDTRDPSFGALDAHSAHRRWRRHTLLLLAGALSGASVMLLYLIVRNLALFGAGYGPVDRFFGTLLLFSEIYVAIQGLGYYVQVAQSSRAPNVARQTRLAPIDQPAVAIYIATYDESEDLIEETVAAVSLLDYPNKRVYVNCDHQSEEQAAMVATIARRHQVGFMHRVPNTGYKAGGINAFVRRLGRDLPAAELLCIFDADSVPVPTFLREVTHYFEEDPRLAIVQAPQSYGNRAASLVADAAGHQQAVFGHYISEGKQQSEAMFFCGTNGIFRVDALRDIGGLVTASVTEDFATSLKLHARGWRSQYCNSAYVTGMGPTTLGAYWTQQSRWALGNLESFFMSARSIFFQRGFTPLQRWEYFLTGSYYFVGWNTFIAMICPAVFLLFGVRPLLMSPWLYALAYLPHFVLSNWFFFMTMGHRGFRPRVLFLAQCLTVASFPVYMASATAALLRRKQAFAVTPKGMGAALPWRALAPQIAMLAVLMAAVVAGIARLVLARDLSIVINIVWCLYHGAMLATLPLFNTPAHEGEAESLLGQAA